MSPARDENRRRIPKWSGLTSLVLLAGSVASQSPDPNQFYVESVDVRLVHLDVLVEAGDGMPVLGLGPDDFALEVEGEPVPFDFFSPPVAPPSTMGPQRVASETPEVVPNLERGVDSAQHTADRSESLGDWILYFDDVSLPPPSRERVRRSLRNLFETWADGPSIHVVFRRGLASTRFGPFDQPAQALSALDAVDRGLARATSGSWDSFLQDMAEVERGCRVAREFVCGRACVDRKLEVVRRFVAIETERVDRTLGDLADMMSTFDSGSRRSTMVYVGDGLEVIPGRLAYHVIGDVCEDFGNEMRNRALESRRDRFFDQVGALANAQRVTLHMLDAGGIRQPGTTIGSSFAVPRSVEMERFVSLQSGFVDLATATGGAAVLNTPLPGEPLRQAAVEQLARYEMGFVLHTPPSGRLLNLRLRLRDGAAGRTLSYRRTFFDQKPKDRMIQRLRGQLDPVAGPLTESVVFIEAGKAMRVNRSTRKVPLTIHWPADRVTLIPGPDGVSGRVLLALVSAGPKGKLEAPRELPLVLGDGGLAPNDGRFELVVGLTLAKGSNRVALAVWDQASGEQWMQRIDLDLR